MESQVPRASENLELDGLEVVGLECDVSSEESVADAFARTLGAFGRVDAVVASAGKLIYHVDRSCHDRGDQGSLKITPLSSAPPFCPSSLEITSCHADG